MDNLNEIKKEGSIIQNCATGHHDYNQDNAMITMIDGRLVMALRCSACGAEHTRVVPGLEGMASVANLKNQETPKPEGTMETVRSTDAPREEFRDAYAPVWAEEVTERYVKDKTLDSFWDNIRDIAKSKK